jgi:hypothetical protein
MITRHKNKNRNKDPSSGVTKTRTTKALDQSHRAVTLPLSHMSNGHTGNRWTTIQIHQQNTNKSLISQLDLLQTLQRGDYNMCLIQEPYIDFRGKTRANWNWIIIYPDMHQQHPNNTRSVILVNTNLSMDSCKQIHLEHPDISAVELQGQYGMLHILNIYNDCKNNSSLMHLSAYMRDRERQQYDISPLNTMWLGDFNRHHLIWNEARNAHLFTQANLNLTQPLLNMLG